MAVWRLWMLCLAALVVLEGHCGSNIAGCESGSVDIVENTSPSLTCVTLHSDWIEWRANDFNDFENTFPIGYCDREKCQLREQKIKLHLERPNSYTSVLTILDIKRDTAHQIICNNTETVIYCTLRIIGLEINNCVDGSVDIAEDTSPSLTCGTFRSGWLDWVTDTLHIGSCDDGRCTPDNNMYQLRLENSSSGNYKSELTIAQIQRYTPRTLSCVNYAAVKTCSLRIFAPVRIVSGNCSVMILNWRVQGSCEVENMWMLSDSYTCTWRKNSFKITGGFQDHREYYWNSSRLYWKKICSFSELMPVHGNKFIYSIEIDPCSKNFFFETINIIPPQEPEHNCTDNVIKGFNVTCTCTTLNMGNPPANLAWDGKTDGILLLQNVERKKDNSNYTCRLTWGPNGFINKTIVYTLRVVEKEQASAAYVKGWMIGVVSVVIITIIGTLIVVYMVKRRKGTICKGKIHLKSCPCFGNFFHRKKPSSQSNTDTNMSQAAIVRHAAPSGNLYTVVMTTTSGQVDDEYVTLSETFGNTEMDNQCNSQTYQNITKRTESRTNATIESQQTTAGGRNFSDLSDTCYMNVTEVLTYSGLGVYHIVPWAVMSAQQLPDTGANYEAVRPEEEYNFLQFEEDRTGQDDTAVYHHLKQK